jgi:hypothetical protein
MARCTCRTTTYDSCFVIQSNESIQASIRIIGSSSALMLVLMIMLVLVLMVLMLMLLMLMLVVALVIGVFFFYIMIRMVQSEVTFAVTVV